MGSLPAKLRFAELPLFVLEVVEERRAGEIFALAEDMGDELPPPSALASAGMLAAMTSVAASNASADGETRLLAEFGEWREWAKHGFCVIADLL